MGHDSGDGGTDDGGSDAGAGNGGNAAGAGGGQECESSSELVLSRLLEVPLCAGQQSTIKLRVSGGTPEYHWTVGGDGAAVSVSENAGSEISVLAEPASLQSVVLRAKVTDRCGRQASESFPLEILPELKLLQTELPGACSGRLYQTELSAEGGDRNHYRWSAELPPGLALDGPHLYGSPQLGGKQNLVVHLEDDYCKRTTESFELSVVPHEECPIRVEDNDPPATAQNFPPEPCRDFDYSLRVRWADGKATWRAVQKPEGFESTSSDSASETFELRGKISKPEAVVLQATDEEGHAFRVGYELTPRDTCWLAYLATDQSPTRLEVLDPVLHRVLPKTYSYPAPTDQDGVQDFRFSRDGRFLAYRLGTGSSSRRLRLLQMTELDEQEVPLSGSAIAYEFSPDSSYLAVITESQGTLRLNAFALAINLASTASSHQVTITERGSTVLPNGSPERLAFFAQNVAAIQMPDGVDQHKIEIASLGETGFSPVLRLARTYTSPTMVPKDVGLYVYEPPALDLFVPRRDQLAEDPLRTQWDRTFVSPTGEYTARVENRSLELFLATDNERAIDTVTGHCEFLLSWAQRRNRLACLNDGEISFYDIDEHGKLSPPTVVTGVEHYSWEKALDTRRVLSPSGAWLAYFVDEKLWLANLSQSADAFMPDAWKLGLATDSVALSFSWDERWLIQQKGEDAVVRDLAHPATKPDEASLDIGPLLGLEPIKECDGDSWRPPDRWCGSLGSTAFKWSPNAEVFAFGSADGLQLYDLSRADPEGTGHDATLARDCGDSCPSAFEFQPCTKSADPRCAF